jgi:CubicO group peptidase (beta-lactamase class C family)
MRIPSHRLATYLIATCGAVLVSCVTFAAPPSGFEHRVETLRMQAGVPGMAVAIVENDTVTFAKGFGSRALGKPEPVDGDTLFQTGSTGKAFTVAALGVLVDEGKLRTSAMTTRI